MTNRDVRLLARNALDGFLTERRISESTRDMYRSVLLACVVYTGYRFVRVMEEIKDKYITNNPAVTAEADLDFLECLFRVMSVDDTDDDDVSIDADRIQLREYPRGFTSVERWVGQDNPQAAHVNFDCSIDTAILLLLRERVK